MPSDETVAWRERLHDDITSAISEFGADPRQATEHVLDIIEPLLIRGAVALINERLAHSHTIAQRDRAEEWADALAYAIAPESVIGEHSSMNNPWRNALEAADGNARNVEGP